MKNKDYLEYEKKYLREEHSVGYKGHFLQFPNKLWSSLEQCKAITGDSLAKIVRIGLRKEIKLIKKRAQVLAERGVFQKDGFNYGRGGRKIST